MSIFDHYYNTLLFSRVDAKNGFAIYGAHILTHTNEQHYIFLFIPIHLSTTDRDYIYNLPWVNLQTRKIYNDLYNLKKQRYEIPRSAPDKPLSLIGRHDTYTLYHMNDFEVKLLHNPKNKSQFQYHDKVMLITALDTWNCIVTKVNNRKNYQLL